MLKTITISNVLTLIVVLLFFQNSLTAQNTDDYDTKLRRAESDMKEYLIEMINNNWDYFHKYGIAISSNEDLLQLKYIPIKIFKVDSLTLFNLEASSITEPKMELDTNHIMMYGIRDNKPLLVVRPKYSEGKWINGHGYRTIFPKLAEQLEKIFKSGNTVFQVEVYTSPRNNRYSKAYIVYNDGKQFISITPMGEFIPLKKALIEWRDDEIKNKKKYEEMRKDNEKEKEKRLKK